MENTDINEEKHHKRRLLFLLIWFFFLTIFLSTITYAWFSSNRIVDLHFFDVHVETDGGLEISENAIDWKSMITVDELKSAYNTYPSSMNQIPGVMNPMSSGGTVDGNGYLNIFYGHAENGDGSAFYLTTFRKTEERTTELSNNGDFIAFDVFVRSTTPKSLYLDGSSYVLPKGEEDSRGIENSARVAFIKEGNVPSNTNIETAQNLRTNNDNNVVLWEPNYDVHTEHGIANAERTYGIYTTKENADIIYYDGVIGTVNNSAKVNVSNANAMNYPDLFKRADIDVYTKKNNTENKYLFDLDAGITKIRLYMWLEGQDVDSENMASEGDITYFIRFTLNP